MLNRELFRMSEPIVSPNFYPTLPEVTLLWFMTHVSGIYQNTTYTPPKNIDVSDVLV